jgi:hypothetical protein
MVECVSFTLGHHLFMAVEKVLNSTGAGCWWLDLYDLFSKGEESRGF